MFSKLGVRQHHMQFCFFKYISRTPHQYKLTPNHGYQMHYSLTEKRETTSSTVLVAIFQSSSGYRPERDQIIDVWAKLLERLASSLRRVWRRRGGRGNKQQNG